MRGILTYHSIDDSGSPISVSPRAFEAHARFLAGGRVRVVGLETIAALPDEEDAVAITFDDGFTNFATEAWPRLRELRLPATLFVVTDRAGGTNAWDAAPGLSIPTLPLLAWEDLRRLAGEGLTLGAHGRTHASLPGLPREALETEVRGSRDRILAETGKTPVSFAYPFGDVDPASAASARSAFSCAVTTRFGLLGRGDDPHLLPRLDAYYLRSNDRLESFGSGGFRRWLALRGAARRAGLLARGLRRNR
ncbi:MAG: polysaccharide deacetylase family protein [Planctomycetota bacterium]